MAKLNADLDPTTTPKFTIRPAWIFYSTSLVLLVLGQYFIWQDHLSLGITLTLLSLVSFFLARIRWNWQAVKKISKDLLTRFRQFDSPIVRDIVSRQPRQS